MQMQISQVKWTFAKIAETLEPSTWHFGKVDLNYTIGKASVKNTKKIIAMSQRMSENGIAKVLEMSKRSVEVTHAEVENIFTRENTSRCSS